MDQKLKREETTEEKKASLKDQRRLEAEERNRRSKIRSALKKELAALEEKIAGMEARKADCEKLLCNPQTHKTPLKIKELQMEFKSIENDLTSFYALWTDLSCKLEEEASITP